MLRPGDRRRPEEPVVYSSRGRALEEIQRPQDALQSYQKALSLDDQDSGLWARVGSVHVKLGDYDSAAKAIDRSLKLDLNNKKGWIVRASSWIVGRAMRPLNLMIRR
jgi:tetratricopeptide (TPR) repeat protein